MQTTKQTELIIKIEAKFNELLKIDKKTKDKLTDFLSKCRNKENYQKNEYVPN